MCISRKQHSPNFMTSLSSRRTCACSEAGFSSKNGDLLWGGPTEEQHSVLRFLLAKGLKPRIFMKKCFLFTAASVYRVKRFTTGWQTFRWWRRRRNGGAEVAETTVKNLLCYCFRRTGKAMGQVYQYWWRICREICFFLWFQCHIFYVLYPFVTYLLTLPRIRYLIRSVSFGNQL
jgi:hypothetical protein